MTEDKQLNPLNEEVFIKAKLKDKNGNRLHQECVEQILEQYDKAIHYQASKYLNFHKRQHTLEDMYQFACLLMIKTIDAYDVERQVPFLNYYMTRTHKDLKYMFSDFKDKNPNHIDYVDSFSSDYDEEYTNKASLPLELISTDLLSSDDITKEMIEVDVLLPNEQLILTDIFINELTLLQIGEKLGISKQAVYKTKSIALDKLRKYHSIG